MSSVSFLEIRRLSITRLKLYKQDFPNLRDALEIRRLSITRLKHKFETQVLPWDELLEIRRLSITRLKLTQVRVGGFEVLDLKLEDSRLRD